MNVDNLHLIRPIRIKIVLEADLNTSIRNQSSAFIDLIHTTNYLSNHHSRLTSMF